MLNRKGIHLWGILLYAFVVIWAMKPEGFDKGMIAYKANDFEKAYQIWMPLAEQGHIEAQYQLGNMLSQYPKEFWQQASKWLLLANQANHEKANEALLSLHQQMSNVDIAQSRQMAQSWMISQYNNILLSAAEGNGVDQMLLGLIYSTGNDHVGYQYTNTAITEDSNMFHDTQVMLGMFYFDRLEKQGRDLEYVHHWFLNAIKAGNQRALPGMSQSAQDATRWYEFAAEQGISEAQLVLAISYVLGDEMDVDFVSAYKWMILATHSCEEGYVKYIGNQLKRSIEIEMSESQLAQAYQFAQRWNSQFQERGPRQPI